LNFNKLKNSVKDSKETGTFLFKGVYKYDVINGTLSNQSNYKRGAIFSKFRHNQAEFTKEDKKVLLSFGSKYFSSEKPTLIFKNNKRSQYIHTNKYILSAPSSIIDKIFYKDKSSYHEEMNNKLESELVGSGKLDEIQENLNIDYNNFHNCMQDNFVPVKSKCYQHLLIHGEDYLNFFIELYNFK
jgi:hypothetical protein